METIYENRGGEVWERHPDGRRELFAEDLIRRLTTLERERNEAREAYEDETASTAELAADNLVLERGLKDLMRQLRTVENALRGLIEAEEATVEEFNAKEIDGLEAAMNKARRVLGSQGEAAETADEKPDGQAENV